MDIKEKLIRTWMKKCLKQNLTPIALLAVDADGLAHVFSHHEDEMMDYIDIVLEWMKARYNITKK